MTCRTSRELQGGLDPLGAVEQRDEPLEVVDGRLVRIGRPRRVGRASQVLALLLLVVAVPEVMGEERDEAVEVVRVGPLDVVADPAVEHRAERERQALVGDLLGDDVLEEVGLVGLTVEATRSASRSAPR